MRIINKSGFMVVDKTTIENNEVLPGPPTF